MWLLINVSPILSLWTTPSAPRRSATIIRVVSELDLDRLCPLPPDPDQLPRVIGRADALARGISRHGIDHRLSTGQWRRVLPRTYLIADSFTDLDRLDAALEFAGRDAALSGAAALWASGVRGRRPPTSVLVVVPTPSRVRSRDWVRVRHTKRAIVTETWTGPRRVEVARAAADLAVDLHRLDDVRSLVARVVQDKHCTIAELGVALDAGPRNGSAYLRQALTEVGWGAASAPEARAARILRRFRITGFVQNATLRLPDGSVRVVDFYWPHLRACLEIDSVEWHFAVDHWSGTWDRHLELSKHGLSVIHRPPSALADERGFAADVRNWLAGREADLRRGLR